MKNFLRPYRHECMRRYCFWIYVLRSYTRYGLLFSVLCTSVGLWSAQMSPTTDITDPALGGWSPSLATNSSGNAIAVWTTFVTGLNVIQGSIFSGGSWSAPQTLSERDDVQDPCVTMNDAGDAFAVWNCNSPTDSCVEACFFDHTSGLWGSAVDLTVPGVLAYFAKVKMNSAGDAIAVWEEQDTVGYPCITMVSVYSKTTGTWAGPVALSVDPSASNPQVAMNDGGQAIVVWTSIESMGSTIEASLYDNGTWSFCGDISPTDENADECRVGIDANGNCYTTWEAFTLYAGNFYRGAYYSYYLKIWLDSDILVSSIPDPADFGFCMNPLSNTSGVCTTFDGSTYSIQVLAFISGYLIGPMTVSSSGVNSRGVAIGMNNSNDIVVMWDTPENGRDQLAQYVGGQWSSPQDITDDQPEYSCLYLPRRCVNVNDKGQIVAVWEHFIGSQLYIGASTGTL